MEPCDKIHFRPKLCLLFITKQAFRKPIECSQTETCFHIPETFQYCILVCLFFLSFFFVTCNYGCIEAFYQIAIKGMALSNILVVCV